MYKLLGKLMFVLGLEVFKANNDGRASKKEECFGVS